MYIKIIKDSFLESGIHNYMSNERIVTKFDKATLQTPGVILLHFYNFLMCNKSLLQQVIDRPNTVAGAQHELDSQNPPTPYCERQSKINFEFFCPQVNSTYAYFRRFCNCN